MLAAQRKGIQNAVAEVVQAARQYASDVTNSNVLTSPRRNRQQEDLFNTQKNAVSMRYSAAFSEAHKKLLFAIVSVQLSGPVASDSIVLAAVVRDIYSSVDNSNTVSKDTRMTRNCIAAVFINICRR